MSAGDTETVTILRPPGKDAYGDTVTGDTTEFDIDGCLFAPGPSKEQGFAANTVDTNGTIYAPAGIPAVLPTDRVRIRGELYSVAGKPQVWGSAGVVIVVRLVTG